jgi:GDP-D-mannose 3', 5'-epimerase
MFWKNKRVIVTGCAGMIGSEVCTQLIEQGATVYGVDNLSRGRREFVPEKVIFYKRDLRNRFAPWIYNPDLVIHLACKIGGVGKMHNEQYDSGENLLIDRHVFDYVKETGCKLYFMSSACIYNTQNQTIACSDLLLSEDMDLPARPESIYGWAKLMGELQVKALNREFSIPCAIGRAFNAVGKHECDKLENSHVIPALIQKVLLSTKDDSEVVVWGSGNQERSFIHTSDTARAILLLSEKVNNAEVYNIGWEERYRINDIAKVIITLSGKNIGIKNDLSKPEGVFTRAANTEKIQKLGWVPKIPLMEILKKTYQWWKEIGMETLYGKNWSSNGLCESISRDSGM